MRVDDLRTEHLNYATSAVVKLFELCTPAQKTQLKLLLDKIICHVPNELYRFNMQDDVQMLENFTALFKMEAIDWDQLSEVHWHSEVFLNTYLITYLNTRALNGKHFASLINSLAKAREVGISKHRLATILNLEQLFLREGPNQLFCESDVLSLF
jgi:hypothetical protein